MRNNPYILRCYARPENDYILGICIDLNIAVRGDSVDQVKQEMTTAITSYFKGLTQDNFRDLLFRPAPLKFWLDYYRVCFLININTFREKSAVFFEQMIPQKFSIIPCV